MSLTKYNDSVAYESSITYQDVATPTDTGIYGSTLNDELNRLANGGATYPDYADYLDQAAAARAWAAVLGIDTGQITDLVGVLNYIGGITERQYMLDLAGICNWIAGTFWLEPAAALREVAS